MRSRQRSLRGFALVFGLLVVGVFPLSAQETGTVQGRVVNADGGLVTDALVRVVSLGARVPVDSSGIFIITDVPPGNYLAEAESPRFGHGLERFQLGAGQTVSVLLVLDPLFQLDELVISAGPNPVRRSETYQPTSALSGWDLIRDAEASLGETLAEAPGVTASYNGPGSSRPIIRGLSGDRVRILESGVGSGDVSSQGPDHAVGIEPMTAERIEIVRGPATLLYTSGAMGGVVNVLDGRIPREVPSNPFSGSVMGLAGSVANERTAAAQFNGGARGWAWHLSGLKRKTGDYDIPGYAAHQHEEDHAGEAAAEEEEPYGTLPNSAVESERLAFGASWVREQGFLGFSLSGLNQDYGVPGHGHGEEVHEGPAHDEHGEEDVVIGLEQRRFDAEGAWRFSEGVVRGIQGRVGGADYQHTEYEGDLIGTRFTNDQWEGRLQLDHALVEDSPGSFGIQAGARSFEALGDEAYVPPSKTRTLSGFLFQEFEVEPVKVQVGFRAENQWAEAEPTSLERDHFGFSVSGGVNWTLAEGVSLALAGARSQRTPSLEELFSDGPHAATFAYEIGNSELGMETAYSVDATLRFSRGLLSVEATGFLNAFDGFIYQQFTGEEEEELPVLQTVQGDARFLGGEGSVEFDIVHTGRHHLLIEGWGDYVRAQLTRSDEPLPRIPPLRIGTRLRYNGGTVRADLGLTTVTRQDRVAPLEEETDGYSMVDLSVGYRLFHGGLTHDFVLRGSNLTNQEARNHTSFLKELAPLPGRDIRLMYRVYF